MTDKIKIAVVGAHLNGMPLHSQLTDRNAEFIGYAKTAAKYKLYAIANSVPPKPALIYDENDGKSIELEIYSLGAAEFGTFVALVPPPLAIGTVELEDGSLVKGFVAEPRAIIGAKDITSYGGWRAFITAQ